MTANQEYLLAGGLVLACGLAFMLAGLLARGGRDVDRLLATIPPAPVVTCGECADAIDDALRAPSCLSHDTCLACAPTPHCSMCAYELEISGLADPTHEPVPFGLTEQAWGWGR